MAGRTLGRIGRAAFLVASLIVWSPALLFGTAIGVAELAGCELSEAEVRPCVIAGLDLGTPLTLMAILGWVVLAFLPFMTLTLGVGVVWAGVRLGRAGWRAVRAARGAP